MLNADWSGIGWGWGALSASRGRSSSDPGPEIYISRARGGEAVILPAYRRRRGARQGRMAAMGLEGVYRARTAKDKERAVLELREIMEAEDPWRRPEPERGQTCVHTDGDLFIYMGNGWYRGYWNNLHQITRRRKPEPPLMVSNHLESISFFFFFQVLTYCVECRHCRSMRKGELH